MGNKLVKSVSGFSLHLNGESSVDAELLSKAISDMASLSKAIANTENPDAYLKLNVSAFKNGSFEIAFSAICEIGNYLQSHPLELTQFAANVTAIVVGCFEVKKFLKGKRASNVESKGSFVKIENCDGQTLQVVNGSQVIINNMQIDNMVTNIALYAKENNPNDGFNIHCDGRTVECTSKDLMHMSQNLPLDENQQISKSASNVVLVIKKPDLLGSSKWSFRLGGRAIDATIEDKLWLGKVQSGDIVIRAKDNISALLETRIDLDEYGVPIDGTSHYSVITVHKLFSPMRHDDQVHF